MPSDKIKAVYNVRKNLDQIFDYFKDLSDEEIFALYSELKEIFLFYGFQYQKSNFLLKYLISDKAIEEDPNLSELEGLTNAILFYLKYTKGKK